jgi:hypothetical protein
MKTTRDERNEARRDLVRAKEKHAETRVEFRKLQRVVERHALSMLFGHAQVPGMPGRPSYENAQEDKEIIVRHCMGMLRAAKAGLGPDWENPGFPGEGSEDEHLLPPGVGPLFN